MTNRKAIRRARRMRRVALTISMMLLVAILSVGATIAWLTDKTDPITNTFTVGDIEITLTEENPSADKRDKIQIVPGTNITKDPKVTVEHPSEACYLFVMVKEENWPDKAKVGYSIDTAVWTELEVKDLPENTKLYWCDVAKTTAPVEKNIIANKTVTVANTLNEEDMEKIEDAAPSLAFKAFAVQKDNVADATTAWGYVDSTAKTWN